MASTQPVTQFRETDEVGSGLTYFKEASAWFTGGLNGVKGLPEEDSVFVSMEFDNDGTAIAVDFNTAASLAAVAFGSNISIRNAQSMGEENFLISDLLASPVTHLAFNKSGTHL